MSKTLDFDPDALREKYRHERDRRLRPDANDQYVEITADFRHYVDDPHVESGFTRESLTDAVDVVIVGGGFGGLTAARGLRKAPVRVTLIDRRNFHLFQPLLYQVATAGLSAPDIAAPLRHILRGQRNVTVLMAEVERVEPATSLTQIARATR